MEGKGHIMEAVIIHDSRIRLLREEQPLNFAIITLDQAPGINFLSNLPGPTVGEAPVGSPVELIFQQTPSGQLIHEWQVIS